MAITKQKKQEIVAKLEKGFKTAKSIVFLNTKGIKVNEQTILRRTLREQKVGYTVAKKTLVSRALDNVGLSGSKPDFGTELSIAWSEDNLASHREIGTFALKNKDKMKIVGGVFDGVYVGAAKVVELATIPPMKTLQAQFVNLINSPIQRFVMALSEVAKKKPQA